MNTETMIRELPMWTRLSLVGVGFNGTFVTPWLHKQGRVDTMEKWPLMEQVVEHFQGMVRQGSDFWVVIHDDQHKTVTGVLWVTAKEIVEATVDQFRDTWGYTPEQYAAYTLVQKGWSHE